MTRFLRSLALTGVVSFACTALCEEAQEITLCDLKADPSAYNHKTVRVTAFAVHAFEDFTLFDPRCPAWPDVWLEYGGKTASGTIYCCGVSAERDRAEQLIVEEIPIPLARDTYLEEFDRLIQRPPDAMVHATVVGHFFAGQKQVWPKATFWGGYGHMGCCTLLTIERVASVDKQDRHDLDYRGKPDMPASVACSTRDLLDLRPHAGNIEAQKQAAIGARRWSFDEPQRVAADTLRHLLGDKSDSTISLTQTGKMRAIHLRGQIKRKSEGLCGRRLTALLALVLRKERPPNRVGRYRGLRNRGVQALIEPR